MDDEKAKKKDRQLSTVPDTTSSVSMSYAARRELTKAKPVTEDDSDDLYFGPSSFFHFRSLLLSFFLAFVALALLTGVPQLGVPMTLAVIYFLLDVILGIFRTAPSVTLTKHGIHMKGPFKSSFHKWSDVGDFDDMILEQGLFSSRYLCCYTRLRHDAIIRHGKKLSPGVGAADVRFDITGMKMGRSSKKAKQLICEINRWRAKYASAEDSSAGLSEEEVAQLYKKARGIQPTPKLLFYLFLIMIVIPSLFLIYYIWYP